MMSRGGNNLLVYLLSPDQQPLKEARVARSTQPPRVLQWPSGPDTEGVGRESPALSG